MKEIQIENKIIGKDRPTYFIADVAANHDGNIERAKELIYLCAEAGADAAKFQHFTADTIEAIKVLSLLMKVNHINQNGRKACLMCIRMHQLIKAGHQY